MAGRAARDERRGPSSLSGHDATPCAPHNRYYTSLKNIVLEKNPETFMKKLQILDSSFTESENCSFDTFINSPYQQEQLHHLKNMNILFNWLMESDQFSDFYMGQPVRPRKKPAQGDQYTGTLLHRLVAFTNPKSVSTSHVLISRLLLERTFEDVKSGGEEVTKGKADVKKESHDSKDTTADVKKESRDSGDTKADVKKESRDSGDTKADVKKESHDSEDTKADVKKESHDSEDTKADIKKESRDGEDTKADIKKENHDSEDTKADVKKESHDGEDTKADINKESPSCENIKAHKTDGSEHLKNADAPDVFAKDALPAKMSRLQLIEEGQINLMGSLYVRDTFNMLPLQWAVLLEDAILIYLLMSAMLLLRQKAAYSLEETAKLREAVRDTFHTVITAPYTGRDSYSPATGNTAPYHLMLTALDEAGLSIKDFYLIDTMHTGDICMITRVIRDGIRISPPTNVPYTTHPIHYALKYYYGGHDCNILNELLSRCWAEGSQNCLSYDNDYEQDGVGADERVAVPPLDVLKARCQLRRDGKLPRNIRRMLELCLLWGVDPDVSSRRRTVPVDEKVEEAFGKICDQYRGLDFTARKQVHDERNWDDLFTFP